MTTVRCRQGCDGHLNAVFEQLNVVSSGGSSTLSVIFEIDAIAAVLSDILTISRITNRDERRFVINKVVAKPVIDPDVDSFLKRIETSADTYLKAVKSQKWLIVCPINIDPSSLRRRRSFTVTDRTIRVAGWKNLKGQLDLDSWFLSLSAWIPGKSELENFSFPPLTAEAFGRSAEFAFLSVEPAFALLRAAINWMSSVGRFQLVQDLQPMGKIVEPPSYGVFSSAGNFETHYYSVDPPRKYLRQKLRPEEIDGAKKLMCRFTQDSKAPFTRRLVTRGFLLYGVAISSPNPQNTFLALWQVLDTIAHSGKKDDAYNIGEVRERINGLLGDDLVLRALLGTAYEKRNTLVHEGHFDGGIADVNHLKAVVERSLGRLSALSKSLKDWSALEFYYRNANKDADSIVEKRSVLNLLSRDSKSKPS